MFKALLRKSCIWFHRPCRRWGTWAQTLRLNLSRVANNPVSSYVWKITFYNTNFRCTVQQNPSGRAIQTDFSHVKVAQAGPVVLFLWISALRFSNPPLSQMQAHMCWSAPGPHFGLAQPFNSAVWCKHLQYNCTVKITFFKSTAWGAK